MPERPNSSLTPWRTTGTGQLSAQQAATAPRGEVETDAVFETRRQTPGSLPFVPAAAGLVLASAVVYDLIGIRL